MGRGGQFHPDQTGSMSRMNSWARSSPYVREVYHSPAEGTVVFQIRHPDPERYLKAWQAYRENRVSEAIRLEPELARP